MPTRANRGSRPARDQAAISPVLWFALLERARRTADRELERRARRALSRSGIRVAYGPRQQRRGRDRLTPDEVERIAARLAELLRGMPRQGPGQRTSADDGPLGPE